MKYHLSTVSYFMAWGLVYGVLLGAFSGTAILPYFGTMYSTMWGIGIGLGSGALAGIVASILRARGFNQDTDLVGFRRFMAIGIGGLIAIAAPIMLILTTHGFLWGSGMLSDMMPWNALSLFSASFWGGLSAAYIANHYTAYIANLTARSEYEGDFELDRPQARSEAFGAFRTLLRAGLNRWVFMIGAGLGGVIYATNAISIASFGTFNRSINLVEGSALFVVGCILGLIATFFLGLYVSFGNASLITFLKRLIFREYFSHLPPRWTRWILTLTAFIFTGAVTFWSMILAPIIAFIVAATVYRTLALPDETIDKAKRKEKNALSLEEGETENEMLIDDSRVMETRKA